MEVTNSFVGSHGNSAWFCNLYIYFSSKEMRLEQKIRSLHMCGVNGQEYFTVQRSAIRVKPLKPTFVKSSRIHYLANANDEFLFPNEVS